MFYLLIYLDFDSQNKCGSSWSRYYAAIFRAYFLFMFQLVIAEVRLYLRKEKDVFSVFA